MLTAHRLDDQHVDGRCLQTMHTGLVLESLQLDRPALHALQDRDAHRGPLARRRCAAARGEAGEQHRGDGARARRVGVKPRPRRGRFTANAPPRPADAPFTVAFVGRVTPIKDVRTVLAAMRLVAHDVPQLVVRILGPMNEDPEYAERCQVFARGLGLQDVVRFEGSVDIRKELPHVDVLLLTSISEAQPLVVLEAGAFGVPVVATDVGSCRELLEGRTTADQALGIGGLLTPIASPGEVARCVRELYLDPELRRRMGRKLQQRVHRFYDERDMVAAYRNVYASSLAPAEVK